MKKYELIESGSIGLFRIKALRDLGDFGDVKAGDIGGYVASEDNLSHEGDCWIYGEAIIRSDAVVSDNAKVSDFAVVKDSAKVCGDAIVDKRAAVRGNAVIDDLAIVSGNAVIDGDARVTERATVTGQAAVSGNAVIGGDGWIGENAQVSGDVKVYGYANISGVVKLKGDAVVGGFNSFAYGACEATPTIVDSIKMTFNVAPVNGVVRLYYPHVEDMSGEMFSLYDASKPFPQVVISDDYLTLGGADVWSQWPYNNHQVTVVAADVNVDDITGFFEGLVSCKKVTFVGLVD